MASSDEDLSDYADDVLPYDPANDKIIADLEFDDEDATDGDIIDEDPGSLQEFIVSDEDEDDILSDHSETNSTASDVDTDEDNLEKSGLSTANIIEGKRTRKPVVPYVPENVNELMLTKGGKVDVDELAEAFEQDEEMLEYLEDAEMDEDSTFTGSDDDDYTSD